MTKLTKLGARRLLKLATILDKADALHKERNEPGYSQSAFDHTCGTPACALGHWAAHNKHRWIWPRGGDPLLRDCEQPDPFSSAEKDFFLTDDEDVFELFDFDGCGNARTAKQAAKYIRSFVARKGVA